MAWSGESPVQYWSAATPRSLSSGRRWNGPRLASPPSSWWRARPASARPGWSPSCSAPSARSAPSRSPGAAWTSGTGSSPTRRWSRRCARSPASLPRRSWTRVLGGARAELARLVPELGPPAGGEQAAPLAPTRLFELLLGMLHRLAERGPVLLVVEDLHWADQSTRDLLGFLRPQPARPGGAGADLPLRRAAPAPSAAAVAGRAGPQRPGRAAGARPAGPPRAGRAARRDPRRAGRSGAGRGDPGPLGGQPVLRRGAARRPPGGRQAAAGPAGPAAGPGGGAVGGDATGAGGGGGGRRPGGPRAAGGRGRPGRRAARVAAARGGHPPRAGRRRGQRRLRLPPRAGAGGGLRRPAAGAAWPAACRLRPRPGRAVSSSAAPSRGHRRAPPSSGASSPTTGMPPTTWARLCWPACRPGRPRRRPRRWPRPSGTTSGRWRCGTRCPRRPAAARWTGSRCCTAPPRRPTLPAATTARSPWRAWPSTGSTRPPSRCGPARCWSGSPATTGSPATAPRRWPPIERAVATIPAEPPSPELARALAAHGQLLMLLSHQAEARARSEEAVAVARQVGARAVEGHALTTLGSSLGVLGQMEAGIADLEQGLQHRQGVRQPRRPGPGARQPCHRPGDGRPFRRRRRGLPGRRRPGPPVRRARTLWFQPAARRGQFTAEPRALGGGRATAGRGVRP